MGLRALRIKLINCATSPYTVNGYPAVRVLDEDRKPLDVAVSDGASSIATLDRYDGPPRPVTLPPGDWVTAVLLWRNTVTGWTAPPTNGSYLEIAPVKGQPAQIVDPRTRIDLGTTGKLGVTAWARHPHDDATADRPTPG